MGNPLDIIKDLHNSEINGKVEWFYDGQWTATLGDEMNGWTASETFDTLEDAVDWLEAAAIHEFPGSDFEKSRLEE